MKRPVEERLSATQQRLRSFASLTWYEAVITFLFTFAAKTSEVLLALGLTVSTTSFLTDGAVMGTSAGFATAWAWAQAIAIDSSLGVTFASTVLSIKERDWIKVLCYGLLTCLLAIVAGTITNVDTFSHAIHITIAQATLQMGLNVKLLTTLRAIAVVGFLLMSRLKGVSFKKLYEPSPPENARPVEDAKGSESREGGLTDEQIQRLIKETVASFMASLARQEHTMIVEEQETVPLPLSRATEEAPGAHPSAIVPPALRKDAEDEADQDELEAQEQLGDASEEQRIKLARAYQELQADRQRVSGRALAKRAHVRRTTCNQWLARYHPEIIDGEGEEESEQASSDRQTYSD